MTIPGGFKQISPLDLFESIRVEQEDQRIGGDLRSRRQQIRAQAYAQVCAMNRCSMSELTPGMRAYADAIERRMLGDGSAHKGYGFSLPDVEDRRPNHR